MDAILKAEGRKALTEMLNIIADMVKTGISEDVDEWKFSVSVPKRDKRKIIKEAEKWNDVQRQRAIKLKQCYDVLLRVGEELKSNSIDILDWERKSGLMFCPFCKKEATV